LFPVINKHNILKTSTSHHRKLIDSIPGNISHVRETAPASPPEAWSIDPIKLTEGIPNKLS
jgi:hypothetical protein